MRGLSDKFITDLKTGFLNGLLKQVVADKDLDLQIRDNYLNIYYKGNSLLKLTQAGDTYRVDVDAKFRGDLDLPAIRDPATATTFIKAIPQLKAAIVTHGASSLEIEYEQQLIRANNLESRTNSDYFIVDRQYAVGKDRFDLIGVHWPTEGRRRGQKVAPCFLEIKYAQNPDIQQVGAQIQRYYNAIAQNPAAMAQEIQKVLQQKLELGLVNQPADRLDALATLTVNDDITSFQLIVVLIDFNPHSRLLELAQLAALPFAGQVKLFRTGFAMWQQSLQPIADAAQMEP